MAKNNYVKIVSPEGVSKYAWLTQPDTKFDKDGHYKVNLVVSAEEAQPLIKQIDDEMKKSLELAKEKNKGKLIHHMRTKLLKVKRLETLSSNLKEKHK
jgi:hypothetical protein